MKSIKKMPVKVSDPNNAHIKGGGSSTKNDVFDYKVHEEEIKKYELRCASLKRSKPKLPSTPFNFKTYSDVMQNLNAKAEDKSLNGRLFDWSVNNPGSALSGLWTLAVSFFMSTSVYNFFFFVLLAMTAAYFRDNVQSLDGSRQRLVNYLKTEYEILSGSAPTVKKTANEILQEQLEFAGEDSFLSNDGIINLEPSNSNRELTNYNYKVKIKVENDRYVIAELDSDSHISLISESYFHRLNAMTEIKYLPEEPVTFNGLGSTYTSPYSPIELQVQIGRVRMSGRFVVTSLLTSSPILLGTDFTVQYKISIAPYTGDQWFVTIGPLDDPQSKVPAFITNKISLCATRKLNFGPFEIKKVSVVSNFNHIPPDLVKKCYKTIQNCSELKDSPFLMINDVVAKDGTVSVQNRSPVPVELPAGMPLAESTVDLSAYQVQTPGIDKFDLKLAGGGELVESTAELERLLEPGFSPPSIIDKTTELNFIRQHPTIPEEFKSEFISFLEERAELFSGEEFSKKSFPSNIYEHDVELIEEVAHLGSRPFPVSGIRLSQLKEDINELVKNGVLSPGDSPYTSPMFYVLKKSAEGKTAAKGRLCFDYRKINSLIKNKNFPLSSSKNFFDGAAKFKYFCILDIKNAFLSIPLTEQARKLLAVITPFGTFLPNRTPYGLKTSPSAFCFALYKVIGDLPFCHFYMDDIHVGGSTKRELMDNLKIVMDRLYKFNLKIQLSKTKFYVTEVKVLGVVFSSVGKKVDPEKVAAIQNFGEINTLKKVQCFLGMLAFLGSFIPHFSSSCAPLYALLRNQKEKKYTLTEEAMVAYKSIKEYISQTCMLYHPNFERQFYLSTDASNLAAGAFLYQVKRYKKTEKGRNKMLADLGFEITGGGMEPYMLPGVSPGKNTPIVTEFAGDLEKASKYDNIYIK